MQSIVKIAALIWLIVVPILKACGIVAMSWMWVLCPLWLGLAAMIVMFILALAMFFGVWALSLIGDAVQKRRGR